VREKRYTIEEIKKWLAGNLLTQEGKKISDMTENMALLIALSQIDDHEDGIEAVLQREKSRWSL
jgi:hypothetical protein